MDLRGLFLNRGNMSYKHGRSAKYPDVSEPHFWNSGRGPDPTGAAHVSPTAVAEARQTTPTAGSPRSDMRWRSPPADVRILRGNDLLDGARRNSDGMGVVNRWATWKVRCRDAALIDVIPGVPESPAQRRSSGHRNGGSRCRLGERPGRIGSSSSGSRAIDLLSRRLRAATPTISSVTPQRPDPVQNVPGDVPDEL